jgi:hypothetical protein
VSIVNLFLNETTQNTREEREQGAGVVHIDSWKWGWGGQPKAEISLFLGGQ